MGKGRKYCDKFVSTSLKTELAKAYGSVKLRHRGRLSRDKLSSIEAGQQKKWSKVIKLRLISQWNFWQYFRRINKIKLNNKINEIIMHVCG